VDPRLQQAIGNPGIQSQAAELIRLALEALGDLKRLDEGLYERFVASREGPDDASAAEASLRRLWEDTFRGVKALVAYSERITAGRQGAGNAGLDAPVEVDFGDLEAAVEASAEAAPPDSGDALAFDLEASDIGDLLDVIDEQAPQRPAEMWNEVLGKLESIQYGLRTQLEDATARMNVALGAGQAGQVLGLLDDTQSATSEGVHAIVVAIYETFVPDADPSTIVPGYVTSLGRALLVRRGLAELAAVLGPYNDMLQGDDASRHDNALAMIRSTVRAFVTSDICRSMRAADRFQMVQFDQELHELPLRAARLSSEGLVKYLESLAAINQREVLVVHDQRMIEQLSDSVANARELIDISWRTAADMLKKAYLAALGLRGRSPMTDAIILKLEECPPTPSSPNESERLRVLFDELLAAIGT